MTNAQKESGAFEKLSEQIVRHIFKDTDAAITRTQRIKDGGYDIVAECNDGQKVRKVYFECKLRTANLNLRDIAANVIIAFNEGAVAMVALTNHNYTEQTQEQLFQFIKKTVLNIKIIVGEEIKELIENYDLQLSNELSELISETCTNRKQTYQLLRIDFSKVSIHEQLLYEKAHTLQGMAMDFMPEHHIEKLAPAQMFLEKGGLVTVCGFMGVGKQRFVDVVKCKLGYINISIDGALHHTQQHVLLDILLDIWGISATNIFDSYADTHIDSVIERLSNQIENESTLNILRQLFGDTKIQGINDENYNLLICNYIVEMLQKHEETFRYLFVFRNLAYAKDEIFTLLSCFIKKLCQKKIPCIIIQDIEEYSEQRSVDLHIEFRDIELFLPLTLGEYTKNEATKRVHATYPEIPSIIAENIIAEVGTRETNIALFLEHIHRIGISFSDYKRMTAELQMLQPNNIPSILNKVLEQYRANNAQPLFDLLYLLCGKISNRLCGKLAINLDLLERLTRERILNYHQGYYTCANRITYAIIKEWGYEDNPRLHNYANEILKICEEEQEIITNSEKSHLLKYIGEYEAACEVLRSYIDYLERERQFDALIDACDTLIDLYQRLNKPLKKIECMIFQLRVMDIKKILLTPEASERIHALQKCIERYAYLQIPYYYRMACDYFFFMVDFKNGIFDTSEGNGFKMRHYFENSINGNERGNYDDWLGHICNRYVLCVKESEGYDAALVAYESVRKVLPESDRLWRGYISHLACMRLYDNPDKAFGYYEQLIASSHEKKGLFALPFHEYVDRAMSKLFSGDIESAAAFAMEAIDICRANAILDELGRGLNVLGCTFVCQNKVTEARELFKESMNLLKISGYKLFCWRSQLNYIHTALVEESSVTELKNEFESAYQCFSSLLGAKIVETLKKSTEELVQTRDYYSLLAFGLYQSKLYDTSNEYVFGDFELGSHEARYFKDLHELQSTPLSALPNSPFYRSGMLMIVG